MGIATRTADRIFYGIARAAGARAIHPTGRSYAGAFRALPGTPLAGLGERDALVRFSRGFGLPEPLPELPSLAVKLLDAHGPGRDQDFLLSAVLGPAPGLRHVFRPGRSHFGRTYSSVLPFRLAGAVVLFGATLDGTPDARAADLEELDRACELRLAYATPRGRWQPFGAVALGERLPLERSEALRFDPAHLGGPVAPAGRALNAVRSAAYRGSRRGRR